MARSLLKVEVDDHDPNTQTKRGDAAERLHAALDRMMSKTMEIRRFRDSVHHADERINYMAGESRIETGGPALRMGCFGGPPLIVSSTVIDDGTWKDTVCKLGKPKKTATTIGGYVASIELTHAQLEVYSAAIYEVFTSLPWDPGPNSRGLHFGDDDGDSF